MIVPNQLVEVKWNNSNKKHYTAKGYKFTSSGESILVEVEHLTKSSKSLVRFQCDFCSSEFTREFSIGIRYNNHFCKTQCGSKFHGEKKKRERLRVICEWCETEYRIPLNLKNTSRFCCKECLQKWQSVNFKGSNSSVYVKRHKVNCDWCNNTLLRTDYELSNRRFNFCDNECRNNWHREVYVKSEEFISMSRNIALTNIQEGKYKTTNTQPHLITNQLLDELGIPYKNEHVLGEWSFDIYLHEHNLLIEINGTYWHCDSRIYTDIRYESQLKRIIQDKRKRTFIVNESNIKPLYLWELDINNDKDLCKKLILEYVNNNGRLSNYHSSNHYVENDVLVEQVERNQFIDWDEKDMMRLVDLSVRTKVTKYDPLKNKVFNCDFCGKEKVQNLKYYNARKSHYCSVMCKNLAQQLKTKSKKLGIEHNCDNCGKLMKVRNYRYQNYLEGKTKSLTCSNKCHGEWVGKTKIKKVRVKVNCLNCGKEDEIVPSRLPRYKYCSVGCRNSYIAKNKLLI